MCVFVASLSRSNLFLFCFGVRALAFYGVAAYMLVGFHTKMVSLAHFLYIDGRAPLLFTIPVHHSASWGEAWFPLTALLAASPIKDYLSIISLPCLSTRDFLSMPLQTSCSSYDSFMAACSPRQVPSWRHGILEVIPAIPVHAHCPAGLLPLPFLA